MSLLPDSNLGESNPQNPIDNVHHIATKAQLNHSQKMKKAFSPRSFTLINPTNYNDLIQKTFQQSDMALAGSTHPPLLNERHCSIMLNKNIRPCTRNKSKTKQDLVTEEFITNFNSSFGNKEKMIKKANNLVEQMRILGGLGNKLQKNNTDLPEARKGLAILLGINNNKIRLQALSSLLELFKNDPITEESAEGLMDVMISVLEKMDRNMQQSQTISLQIEFAKTYGAIAELLLRHYAKKHLNGITQEFKAQLAKSSKALKSLNRQNIPALNYHIAFALEGILRLKDDKQELIGILGRLYHFSLAAASAYFKDGQSMSSELEKALGEVDINLTHDWYEKTIMMRILKDNILKEKASMIDLLQGIKKNRDLGWNFFYEAAEILSEIAIHGPSPAIRAMALNGSISGNEGLPGLSELAQYNKDYPSIYFKPILSLRLPKIKDPNAVAREIFLIKLMKVAYEAPDKNVREQARKKLISCYQSDENRLIKKLFNRFITTDKTFPKTPELYKSWIDETDSYTEPANDKKFLKCHLILKNNFSTNISSKSYFNASDLVSIKSADIINNSPKISKLADSTLGKS